MSKTLLAVSLLLCASTGLAAEATAKAPATAPAAQKTETFCTYEVTTGSHRPHKVCATRAQRDARRSADQEAMRNTVTNGHAPAQPMSR